MTNRDKLNSMTDEELAKFFCATMDTIAGKILWEDDGREIYWEDSPCSLCPARPFCKRGHNGYLAWLKSDADQEGDGNA